MEVMTKEDMCIGKAGYDKDPSCGCPIFREVILFFEVEMHLEPDGSGHVFLFYPEGGEAEKVFSGPLNIDTLRMHARAFASEKAAEALAIGGVQ